MATQRASSSPRGVPRPPPRTRHPLVAASKPRMGAKPGGPRRVWETLSLRFRHFVVDTEYGPGAVRVHPTIADTLREQESRMAQAEAWFRDPSPLATMISADGRTRKVNPDGFHPMGETA